MKSLIDPLYLQFNYESYESKTQTAESSMELKMHKKIIGKACGLNLPQCKDSATKMFDKWMKSPDQNP